MSVPIHRNRHVGDVVLGGEWFKGTHEALVTREQFASAQRSHTPGQRRSKELLSGKVRCGLCGKVAGVSYNERHQAIYRCKERGQGCKQSGRSANGLHRATVLGLRVLATDTKLQTAIRTQLTAQNPATPAKGPSVGSVIASLNAKQRKLLDLYYADQISAVIFADEERRLAAQITTLEEEAAGVELAKHCRDQAADEFELVTELLASMDLDEIWNEASLVERRTLVEDLVDSIRIYPDRLTVQVTGAPPILVTLDEVGLRGGIKPVVSEGRPAQSPTGESPRGSDIDVSRVFNRTYPGLRFLPHLASRQIEALTPGVSAWLRRLPPERSSSSCQLPEQLPRTSSGQSRRRNRQFPALLPYRPLGDP
jgi:hypothetical protein